MVHTVIIAVAFLVFITCREASVAGRVGCFNIPVRHGVRHTDLLNNDTIHSFASYYNTTSKL